MRTAITIAQTHDGKWKLIADPSVPVQEQKANFMGGRALKADETFALIQYQESDGPAVIHRLVTPEALEAREKQRAEDEAKAKKLEAEEKAKAEKGAKEDQEKREEEHAAHIDAHNKKVEADPNRKGSGRGKASK